MSKIRVLVYDTGRPSMFAELLTADLARQEEVQFVGRVSGTPMDLLIRLRRGRKKRRRQQLDLRSRNSSADVVLIVTRGRDSMSGVCSHLLAEHPDLLVVSVPGGGQTGMAYRRPIAVEPVKVDAMRDLIRVFRSIDDCDDGGE